MNTIVIGVDASERAEDAIVFGRALAAASRDARFVVAGVFASIDHAPLRDATLELASALRDRLGAERADVRAIHDASPARALHRLAEDERAALLVVGSSHVGRYGRVFPGSTAERLLQGAPCAVAIVPSGYRERIVGPPRRVGVAYDGSDTARTALVAATEIARATGAALELIGVTDADGYGTPALTSVPTVVREDVERHLQARLEAALPRDVDATAVRLAGDPAERLGEHSGRLDLLLCGSRGYGPLRAVLLGGVSGRLVRTARCPVIVVPREVEAPLGQLFDAAASAA